jgi:hypothetical protein
VPNSSGATGALDLDKAAQSTPVNVDKTRIELEQDAFIAGFARVWDLRTHKGAFATAMVYDFDSEQGADRFVHFEDAALDVTANTYTYDVTRQPGARGYIISGRTRGQPRVVFCEGVWFRTAHLAFDLRSCADQADSAAFVEDLAMKQYAKAISFNPLPGEASP